ncbi:MAG: long-chain-acyl-CoA synthetase [Beijerinckiaceae bacterium]
MITSAPGEANAKKKPGRRSLSAWIRALEATSNLAANPRRLLADIVDEYAASAGDAPALVSDAQCLTYAALAGQANRYSRWALERLQAGDVVCLIMRNRPDYAAIWLGITRVGGVVALINTNIAGAALAHSLASVSPKHVIVASEMLAALQEAMPDPQAFQVWVQGVGDFAADLSGAPLSAAERPPVVLDDTALLIYTSGTTGLPKAARVTHHRILMWSLWFAGLGDFRASDRMFNCLPMYHSIGGVVAIGSLLAAGGSVVIAEKFSSRRFWPDVVRWECTLFQYIGELCRYLVNAPPCPEERRHRLRLICGNGLRADIWTTFQQRFSVPRIIEFYAATEGTFSLFNIEGEPGAIGHIPAFLAPRFPLALVRFDAARERPSRDAQGRCILCGPNETGEALGRVSERKASAETRFDGYLSADETERKILRNAFEEGDAWFRTGDLMRRDERGFIYFVDRVGDTFRWKGENVSTLEAAATLALCPGVTDAIVDGVSVPGAEGRAGMAAVVVDGSFDPRTFRSFTKERLPAYARPLFLRLCSGLEFTETFKPKKQALMKEGFDPSVTDDALFADDASLGAYVRLDEKIYSKILRGEFRA